jgi:hypothetical protein
MRDGMKQRQANAASKQQAAQADSRAQKEGNTKRSSIMTKDWIPSKERSVLVWMLAGIR